MDSRIPLVQPTHQEIAKQMKINAEIIMNQITDHVDMELKRFKDELQKLRMNDGNNIAGQQRSDEHAEASTWPDEQLQPEVSCSSWGMGERTDTKQCISIITNDKWIENWKRKNGN